MSYLSAWYSDNNFYDGISIKEKLRYQILSIPHLQQPWFFCPVSFCEMSVIQIMIQTYKYFHRGSTLPGRKFN